MTGDIFGKHCLLWNGVTVLKYVREGVALDETIYFLQDVRRSISSHKADMSLRRLNDRLPKAHVIEALIYIC